MLMSREISIQLTEDEAWVLFEFTRRFSDTHELSLEDQSEERALWNLCCIFEKTLHQEEDIENRTFIENCRKRLRDKV
jgi:hypothetical protein